MLLEVMAALRADLGSARCQRDSLFCEHGSMSYLDKFSTKNASKENM
jgi:hypothetical protein